MAENIKENREYKGKNMGKETKSNQRDRNRNYYNQRSKARDTSREHSKHTQKNYQGERSNSYKKNRFDDTSRDTIREEKRDRGREKRQYSRIGSNYSQRNAANETIDDIKEDIVRIEKEIRLEIKEIKSLKLGL